MIDFSRLNLSRRISALRRTIREIPVLRNEVERLKEENLRLLDTVQQATEDWRAREPFVAHEEIEALRQENRQLLDKLHGLEAQIRTNDERAVSLNQRLAEFGRTVDRHPLFREAMALMQLYCQRHSMPSRPFIVSGHLKCGNTMVRFLYHHLIAVTNTDATETLTYSRLNKVNPNHSFPEKFFIDGFLEPEDFDHRGFPLMLHSHAAWDSYWESVGDTLHLERHPVDALISRWYPQNHFSDPPYEVIGIDDYVLRDLPDWLDLFKHNAAHAKARIRYEDMISDPFTTFGGALKQLGIAFDPAQLRRACEMSSFEAVRRMEDARAEQHGHVADPVFRNIFSLRPWKDDPGVRFTRSGETGQWRSELQPQTIAAAKDILMQRGFPAFAAELD